MKTVGEQAKEFRQSRGWSVKRMAEECGTSRQNIETLELTGARTPRYVKRLAEVMGTTVDVLLEGRYEVGNVATGRGAMHSEAANAEVPLPPSNDLPRALYVVADALAKDDRFYRAWPKVNLLLNEIGAEPGLLGKFPKRLAPLLLSTSGARQVGDNGGTNNAVKRVLDPANPFGPNDASKSSSVSKAKPTTRHR